MKHFDYIHGQRWHEVADVIIDSGIDPISRKFIMIEKNVEEISRRDCIIFCKTDYLQTMFNHVRNSKYSHILITSNSDYPINETRYAQKPDNIKHWFCINMDIVRDDVTPIPIGLERPLGGGCSSEWEVIDSQLDKVKEIKNWIYLNVNVDNNVGKRFSIVEHCKQYVGINQRDIPIVKYQKDRVPFVKFIEDMYNSLLILSPEGNGIDCHRTWEALYLGSVPVVNSSKLISKFVNMGLKFAAIGDNYNKVCEQWQTINNHAKVTQFLKCAEDNKKFLNFSYWKQLIIDRKN